jgi:outer membrane protein assembly factor BamA
MGQIKYPNILYLCMTITILFLIPYNALSQADSTADSTAKFKSSLSAYPYAYYTPETQLAFGGGGVYTYYTARDSLLNPSNLTIGAYYATVKTYQVSLVSNVFFAQNRYSLYFDLVYGHYVERFYGVGNDTPELGSEEYVLDNVGGMIDVQLPPLMFICKRGGLVLEYNDYRIADAKDNPYLQSDSIPGSDGGVVAGLGLVFVWDTRDHIFYPNEGGFTTVKYLFYTEHMGSDYTFTWVQINGRHYWSFAPDHVLAWQVYLEGADGNPPFFKLPALGGARLMRGYFYGRYRDFKYFTTQLEYRQFFWRRLGFVVFAGIGNVAPDMTSFKLNEFKPSFGVGLRFLFSKDEKINLRVDLGFGKDTNGLYFGIEEAF